MKNTLNYNLKKPDLEDYVNVADLNDNMDIVDGEIKKNTDKIDVLEQNLETHVADSEKHITAEERAIWNSKAEGNIREDATKPLRVEVKSSLPSVGVEGQIVLDKSGSIPKFKGYTGGKWV
ncbi:hypothetical protein CON65_15965 [Bacillus pseudomycoides]|uniref:Uncharacterized protein n=1 Tax=Bacillus pseudomycoides TaxID=64104 RepID=A0AA91VAS2_9BACI|nr:MULTISPECIES: hypothetical protein [Bacillus]PEB56252.1 hypothetical protein COO03_01400 [Bacillus sp. AFS098217]PED81682.1 hypothetical protein CON65_15965 [Bacillus pseudomycoides]